MSDWFLVAPLPVTLAGALVAAAAGLPTLNRRLTVTKLAWLLAPAPLTASGLFLRALAALGSNPALVWRFDWIPSLGLSADLYFDHLSALFALLVTGIGTLVVVYAGCYFKSDEWPWGEWRFLAYLLLFVTAMLGLVVLGAFTKSAQPPFHIWLSDAVSAPTPASACLDSATMIKAGIYFLARLNPALGFTDLRFWLLGLFGLATMLAGAYLGLRQNDLLNNLGHWGMLIALATEPGPGWMLPTFAALMLLGDLVKLLFLKVHDFTVRDTPKAVLYGLTTVCVVGYSLILLLEWVL